MGSITEIWSTRNLERRLRRHWVRFHEEIQIFGHQPDQSGALSIHQPAAGGPLRATLKVALGQLTEEIVRGSELVIDIHGLRLVVIVRAVEDARALIEFGMPRGNRTKVALGA